MKFNFSDEQIELLRAFVASFASAKVKPRLLALLRTKKGQQTIMANLDHADWLDPRYSTLVPHGSQTVQEQEIERMLVSRGAPELCHVLSTNRSLNSLCLPLREALSKVVGGGSGTILFCVPDKLAYYESETPQERYVCAR